ncbi:phage holin family protein [Nocardioides sp.]|uniref:phage holin family protein n=1 Tax=Nocardioides sp. TaxID=35761 RepID=UPI002735215D|nr:phage holin family protein [Nocardioides sp.]MDP3893848.1 phage holin family protein [Nocardioides sp.]
MAHPDTTTTAVGAGPGAPNDPPAVGELVHRLSEQIPDLVRSEIRLAQAEMTQKGKRAGVGIGMFSAAGLLGFFGLAVLIATAILALALVLPAWAAALIVGVVLLIVAGVVAMVGRSSLQDAVPPTPERATEGARADVAAMKGEHS